VTPAPRHHASSGLHRLDHRRRRDAYPVGACRGKQQSGRPDHTGSRLSGRAAAAAAASVRFRRSDPAVERRRRADCHHGALFHAFSMPQQGLRRQARAVRVERCRVDRVHDDRQALRIGHANCDLQARRRRVASIVPHPSCYRRFPLAVPFGALRSDDSGWSDGRILASMEGCVDTMVATRDVTESPKDHQHHDRGAGRGSSVARSRGSPRRQSRRSSRPDQAGE